MPDIIVIGGGPAGLSAAINARQRGKEVLVLWNAAQQGWLQKAEHVANYPGLPGLSGPALLESLRRHAQSMGAQFREGLARQIMPMDDGYAVALGDDYIEAKYIILATGARQPKPLPGEEALLGRGVSYCATCDGMLYRGKRVGVLAESTNAPHEANYLAGLAGELLYFGAANEQLAQNIAVQPGKISAIVGEDRLTGVQVGDQQLSLDGLFILRDAMALDTLLPGLEHDGPFIRVDRQMRTNLPGIFAAGDCTGQPLQVAKAVGEGCVAALAAAE